MGKDGPCASDLKLGGMVPPWGYWCSPYPPRAEVNDGIEPHKTPSGLYINNTVLINSDSYTDLSETIISSWRPYHWYNWFWSIETNNNFDKKTGKLEFERGGFQGAEGIEYGDLWYIENVFNELTMPNEYFYNKTEGILYYYNNETNDNVPPSESSVFVATNLKTIFNITGSQSNPVNNIVIQGLIFKDTNKVYLDNHAMPSSGDWALNTDSLLYLEGTRNISINANLFTRIDNTAIVLRGFNRYVTIENNDFTWIGESAIALWGYSTGSPTTPMNGPDGRNGDQPRFITVKNNMARELGIWQKQSSFFFSAQSCQNYIYNNIVFNIPRAGFNFNDGFGLDNYIYDNLLLNTCRESGDHGNINAWDRLPYITNVRNGSSSTIPGLNNIYRNLLFSNYQVVSGVDTDDGSSYYNITSNVYVYGDMGCMFHKHILSIYTII